MRSVCLEVLEMPDVMRCVPLCILEAVEGGFCLLETPEVIRFLLDAVEGGLSVGLSKFPP